MSLGNQTLTPDTIGGLVPVRASDYAHERKLNILVYGDPGVGKTTFAASADEIPSFRKTLHIDIEGGSMSFEHRYPKVEIIHLDEYDQKDQWQKLYDIYEHLRDNRGAGYGTVIIDNLSEAQKIAMIKVMEDAKLRADDPDKIEPEVPRQRDWGVNLERMRMMVRSFRDLPVHTIITAHEKEATNPRTGAIKKAPSLSGKLTNEVAGFFDIVLRMYVVEIDGVDTRVIATAASEDYIAKDRSDRLPKYVQDPTMAEIYKLMRKEHVDG